MEPLPQPVLKADRGRSSVGPWLRIPGDEALKLQSVPAPGPAGRSFRAVPGRLGGRFEDLLGILVAEQGSFFRRKREDRTAPRGVSVGEPRRVTTMTLQIPEAASRSPQS